MSQLSPEDVAIQLLNARRNRLAWDPADTLALASMDDVYAVQDRVTDQLTLDVGAWKTSPREDDTMPFVAPIYAREIYTSGVKIQASDLFVIGVEGEIAFRMSKDLPAREQAYTRLDILDSILEMLPLIEVVDTRMINGMKQDASLKMADNQSNAGIVIGTGVQGWETINATTAEVHLTANGQVLHSGKSVSPIADMFHLMAGTANACAARNRPICAGDIITTGSCTGIDFVEPGSEVVLEFPGIGRVEVSFPIN